MSFASVRLETGYIIYNTEGGMSFSTDIVVVNSGYEQRNQNWQYPLGKWDYGDRKLPDSELTTLIEFFNARAGMAQGFLFKDWSDYQVQLGKGVMGPLGVGTGLPNYQLTKNYTSGGSIMQRLITKPAAGTIYKQDWAGDTPLSTLARTNLLPSSQRFDNAYWTKTRASTTPNTASAPDGTTTADSLIEDSTANNTHYLAHTFTTAVSVRYGISVFIKSLSANRTLRISCVAGFASTQSAVFDPDAGTATLLSGAGTATITDMGNGWWRASLLTGAATSIATTGSNLFQLNQGSTASYTGDGTSGLYVWGAQVEVDQITPYIPTDSSSVTVTDLDATSGIVTFAAAASASVTGVTAGATTQFTTATSDMDLAAGKLVYLSGLTGADAALLNGLAHTIISVTGTGPYTFTIATNTASEVGCMSAMAGRYPQATDSLSFTGEFDVPVRFDTDQLKARFDSAEVITPGVLGVKIFYLSPLPIVEIRV